MYVSIKEDQSIRLRSVLWVVPWLTPPRPRLLHGRGRIIEAIFKVSVDATRPLPLACALYAVENQQGVWLCAYYGANQSVFDYLPQKDAEIDEAQLGIAFLHKVFIPKDQYQPARLGTIQERTIHGLTARKLMKGRQAVERLTRGTALTEKPRTHGAMSRVT